MGSGNSSPVEKAGSVETEAHQDVFELRFDHLAVGGTTILAICILVLVLWLCRRRNKRERIRHRRRRTSEGDTRHSCCQNTQQWQHPMMPMMSMMPQFPMMQYPMLQSPQSWMTTRTANPGLPGFDTRFTELTESPKDTIPGGKPARPPPINRGLPSPQPQRETTA